MIKRTKKFIGEILTPLEEGFRGEFVIQHHFATQEHWDLRLEWPIVEGQDVEEILLEEWEGVEIDEEDITTRAKTKVLRSWAIPKHRLPKKVGERLMMSETHLHPWEYRNFEGEIPEGKYGAGEVKIYDKGVYEMLSAKPNDDRWVIWLKGDKIDDTFALVPAFGREKNQWLIVKVDKREWLGREGTTIFALQKIESVVLRRVIYKDWTQRDLERLSEKELTINHFLTHIGIEAFKKGAGFGDWTLDELKKLHDAIVKEAMERQIDLKTYPID